MITPLQRGEILRLYHAERWPVGTIAVQLGLHHTTVRRALVEAGVDDARQGKRPSKADLFLPFILQTLERYPRLHASRLYEMVRQRGYDGGPDHFRHVVALHRPRPAAEAYLRLRTLPGEQAQVDWGHFGQLAVGHAQRPLMAFVMVLSYSRMIFLRFFFGCAMESFLRGHVAAFERFAGVPRVLLYDNLKSAVLERRGDAIRFHPTLLALAAHYRYEPRPVAVARGNEKGRVERAVRYVRDSFFAARTFRGLEDLNAQASAWCDTIAAARLCPEDRTKTVGEVCAAERDRLLALPDEPFPCHERVEVHVGKTPYVRFDRNDYSVPYTKTRRTLVVIADIERVRILEGNEEVAAHPRSFSKGEQIEDPSHIRALEQDKQASREHRGVDRLSHAVPASRALLLDLAERGQNLGSATAALLRLLDHYGPSRLGAAIAEALAKGSPHPHSVRLILERAERAQGALPPLPVHLPEDPRIRSLAVRPHSLDGYDSLTENEEARTTSGDATTEESNER
jgi:transposase